MYLWLEAISLMYLFIDYHKNDQEKKELDVIYRFSIYIKLKSHFSKRYRLI